MTRVVWTTVEKTEVFAQLVEVFRRNPVLARKSAFTDAQSVLPYNRRIVVTDQRVFNYKDRIQAAWDTAMKELEKKPPKALGIPAPILAPPPAPERKESTTERLAQAFERLLDIMADAVAAKVAERITPPMSREELTRHVDQQFEAEFTKYPRPRHDPQPIRHPTGQANPGVLVIGLLPGQEHSTVSSRGRRLDLTFLSAEEAINRPKLTRAHTILMTKFISHAVQDKYRKATNLHFCNGGVVDLWKILDSIAPSVV